MLRKLATVAALATIGIAALAPADPYPNGNDDFCTQTGTLSWFEWGLDNSHNPPRGTTDFTSGSTSYHYLGARVSSGDTFRYWGTRP
jgi:hypothetical protein